jgi:hypothetical protein
MITPARKHPDCDINRYTTLEQIREYVQRHGERFTFACACCELTRSFLIHAAIQCECSVRHVCFRARANDVVRRGEPIRTQAEHCNDAIRLYTLRCTFQRFVYKWRSREPARARSIQDFIERGSLCGRQPRPGPLD